MIHFLSLDMKKFDYTNAGSRALLYSYLRNSLDIFYSSYHNSNYENYKQRFDETHLLDVVMKSWTKNDTWLFLAIDKSTDIMTAEKVVGTYVLQFPYSIAEAKYVGVELYFMTDPEYTKYWLGPKLLRLGKSKAKELEATYILNYNTFGYKQEKAALLYKRIGGKKIGNVYRTEI